MIDEKILSPEIPNKPTKDIPFISVVGWRIPASEDTSFMTAADMIGEMGRNEWDAANEVRAEKR
jgi:hypothetical protein